MCLQQVKTKMVSFSQHSSMSVVYCLRIELDEHRHSDMLWGKKQHGTKTPSTFLSFICCSSPEIPTGHGNIKVRAQRRTIQSVKAHH